MRFFSSYKLLLVVMALAVFACAQQETSLGELAKRKGTKKAKIVIGDDDVLHSTAGSQPEPADAASPAAGDAGATGGGAGAKPTQSGSAKSSDPRVAELKDKIDKLSSQEGAVKDALKSNQNRLANAQSDFQREVAQESISNNTHNIDVLSQQRKEAEAQLKALQDSKKK